MWGYQRSWYPREWKKHAKERGDRPVTGGANEESYFIAELECKVMAENIPTDVDNTDAGVFEIVTIFTSILTICKNAS
jgi:hypothetical protein